MEEFARDAENLSMVDDDEGRSYDAARGHVESLRQDVSDLARALTAVQQAAQQVDLAARDQELKAALDNGEELLKRHRLVRKANALQDLEGNERFAAQHSGQLTQIQNLLHKLREQWPILPPDNGTATRALAAEATVAELNYAAVKFCAVGELDDALCGIHTGKSVNLDDCFSSSLPSASDRNQLIAHLKGVERDITGVIDEKNRLAYRTPPTLLLRFLACLSPLLFFLAGGGLLFLISKFDKWGLISAKNWPLGDSGAVVGAYLLVSAGAIMHLTVENVKQLQSKQVPILAIGDLLTWLELRWAGLGWTFVAMVITVIALRYAGVTSDAREIPVWLAAGYSVDSIAGLVLTRFDTAATAGLSALRQRITGESA
jgi:hypothetical protein